MSGNTSRRYPAELGQDAVVTHSVVTVAGEHDILGLAGSQTDLHRRERDRGEVVLRRPRQKWGQHYPAAVRLWDDTWSEFIPFLDYDVEIATAMCSTNAIQSLTARYWRA